MKTKIFAAALALLLTTGALAGTLKGIVTDESDHPMQGVTVSVWGKENIKGVTDARGNFKLTSDELLAGNRYAVKATKEGYIMAQNSFGTEMYEDEEDMEPLEISMKKEDVIPETPAVEHTASGPIKAPEKGEVEKESETVEDEDTEEAKPAETKPAEAAKPAETKPAEEAKPAETKPAETKPVEAARTAETKPAEEAKPAETKPAETK